MTNPIVLVTGATGFVGNVLLQRLQQDALFYPRAVVRKERPLFADGIEYTVVGDLASDADWLTALEGVDTIVHLAARVHVMGDTAADPLAEFRLANVTGTLNLARQAATAGVRRFIYLSSVKVNGEETNTDQAFAEYDRPAPQDAYAISKWEAEQGLLQLVAGIEMKVVIIRPPLVYGPGVKANFLTMMHWLAKGIPLPLGALHNKRSLVGLENLVDLIVTCVNHPAAANQIFLAADGEDLSTTELLRRLGLAMGRPARLVPVPTWLLEAGAALLGRGDIAQRLCGSLQVDISKARTLLGWNPPLSVDEGLRRTAQGFLNDTV